MLCSSVSVPIDMVPNVPVFFKSRMAGEVLLSYSVHGHTQQ